MPGLEVSLKESSGYWGWMFKCFALCLSKEILRVPQLEVYMCLLSASPGNSKDRLNLFGGAGREFKFFFTLKKYNEYTEHDLF